MIIDDRAPPWARRIIRAVLEARAPRVARLPFVVRWEQTGEFFSCGQCWFRRNHLTALEVHAGTRRDDQRLTLLHELAHAILPASEGHSLTYWRTCFALYREYRVPLRYALLREGPYRQQALYGAHLAGVSIPDDIHNTIQALWKKPVLPGSQEVRYAARKPK